MRGLLKGGVNGFSAAPTGAGAASLGQSQKESRGAHCMACDSTKFISDLVPSGRLRCRYLAGHLALVQEKIQKAHL